MRSCFQFETQSVLDHGLSVRSWFVELRNHFLTGATLSSEWRLPDWLDRSLLESIGIDDSLLALYQVYHDCGKPQCLVVDTEGRQHFPDHAAASRRRWLECSDGGPEAMVVAELIGMDMDVHLLRPDGLEEFASRREASALLLTGLCELHSNARMFGGIDSTGFKIKYKRLDKLGRRITTARSETR